MNCKDNKTKKQQNIIVYFTAFSFANLKIDLRGNHGLKFVNT